MNYIEPFRSKGWQKGSALFSECPILSEAGKLVSPHCAQIKHSAVRLRRKKLKPLAVEMHRTPHSVVALRLAKGGTSRGRFWSEDAKLLRCYTESQPMSSNTLLGPGAEDSGSASKRAGLLSDETQVPANVRVVTSGSR